MRGLRNFDTNVHYLYNASTSSYSNVSKIFQTFDASDNLIEAIGQVWNTPTSSWINSTKFTATYDTYNNNLTSLSQAWNTATNTWVNFRSIVNVYDASNNRLSYTMKEWDTTTSMWLNKTADAYVYDANNNELSSIEQVGDTLTWVNNYRTLSTYDVSNNQLSSILQSWDVSSWDNVEGDIYTYTPANKIATAITIIWFAGAWDSISKGIATYNADGELISSLGQVETIGTTVMINQNMNTYTYDAAHDLLTNHSQLWNTATSAWDENGFTTNSSFTDMLPGLVIEKKWDTTTSTFVNATLDTNTYNSYGQLTATYSSTWNDTISAWKPATNYDIGYHYYYSLIPTSVKNVSNNCTASVYPVPAKDMLHVSIIWNESQAFSIEIMDMSGRTVNTRQIPVCKTYDGNISINNLPAGNYIVKMTGTNAQSVQQIVVAK